MNTSEHKQFGATVRAFAARKVMMIGGGSEEIMTELAARQAGV